MLEEESAQCLVSVIFSYWHFKWNVFSVERNTETLQSLTQKNPGRRNSSQKGGWQCGVNLDLLSPIFLLRIKWGVSLSDFCYHHRFGSQEHKVTLFKLKQVGILKNNLTLKMVWRFLQKSRNRTNIWSTSGYLSKGNENVNSKRYMHRHVHNSIIYNSQAIDTTCVHW